MVKIFYSWQSDSESSVNRQFIYEALQEAIRRLGEEANITPAYRELTSKIKLDMDIKDVPGNPPVAQTILKKIAESKIFVPDVTFVGKTPAGKMLCNPNVMIEYGWALAKLGHEFIIPVMNAAQGKPDNESLPFDIRHHKWPVTYSLASTDSDEETAKQKEYLIGELVENIRVVLNHVQLNSTPENTYQGLQPKNRIASFLADGEPVATYRHLMFEEKSRTVYLEQGRYFFLRIIPDIPSQYSALKPVKFLEHVKNSDVRLVPMGRTSGYNIEINEYGVVVYEGWPTEDRSSDRTNTLVQITPAGEIWAIKTEDYSPSDGTKAISYFEPLFLNSYESFRKFLTARMSITSQVKVIAGITGIKGYGLYPPPPPAGRMYMQRTLGECIQENIIEEISNVSLNLEPINVLEPFFESVWEAFKIPRPAHLPTSASQPSEEFSS